MTGEQTSKTELWVRLTHRLFPTYGVGERTRSFLRGIGFSLSAAIISRMVSGITTIVAARVLGPGEFGEANLSLATTLWIQIPLFAGMNTALIRFVSKAPSDERPAWMTDGIGLMSFFFIATIAASYIFRKPLADVFGISESFFTLAVFWCACYWPFILLKSLLNAVERFRFRSTIEVTYAILFPVMFILWIKWGYASAAYILALSVPYALVGVGGIIYLRPALRNLWAWTHRKKEMAGYGLFCLAGGLVAALYESPARLVANRFLDISDVGILSVYQAGSFQMAMFFLAAISQVLFPIASRTPDKKVLFQKINHVLWFTFPLSIVIFAGGLFLYLFLLGRNYPIRIDYVIIFTVGAALSFILGTLNWLFASLGSRGIAANMVIGTVAGGLNLALCLFTIPHLQILGAGVSFLIATATALICFYSSPVLRWIRLKD